MILKSLTRSQFSEQMLLDFGFGWILQKLETHYQHSPDGTAQKSMILYFKTEVPKLREELCCIDNSAEFQKNIQHFRNTISAVDSLLEQSKMVIIAHREAEGLFPTWPSDLEWVF
ncbi:hypothetical protein GCK72_025107 [Caenorhabditis remanei]|uniref:Uncharacterized protein n=1 Tax=Caenorhabditis remanei TaxID=31234 RepID=A0A6A5G105_CAERE|nr:hypothetical protein GCK72_025107 [Caenorhabditis remanei]KAF1748640.1 hypothetical protein GCK72_025107 [Caenorhabditis remanei]